MLSLPDRLSARDLAEMLYLEDEKLVWARSGVAVSVVTHRDSNGAQFARGDIVMRINGLLVKGVGFTAKRGTAVRGISLAADIPAQVEGGVEGQCIAILTEFVKIVDANLSHRKFRIPTKGSALVPVNALTAA